MIDVLPITPGSTYAADATPLNVKSAVAMQRLREDFVLLPWDV